MDSVQALVRSESRGDFLMSGTNGHRVKDVKAKPSATNEERWQRADKVTSSEVEWLLPSRMVQGGLAIVEGETSAGKSTFMAHLAATVSTGKPWLGRSAMKPAGVLWLTGEEDFGSMIRPRLRAAGADERLIYAPAVDGHGEPLRYYLPNCVQFLRTAIEELKLALIIMEPLSSFVGPETDLNSVTSVRAALDPVQRMALTLRCTVLMSRGLRKDRSGPRLSWGQGSAAIADTARTVLQIDCPDQTKMARVLRVAKVYGTRRPSDIAYAIQPGKLGPMMVEFRELTPGESLESESISDLGEKSVRADARRMLRTMLAEGAIRTNIIFAAGADAGISAQTINRAKGELGIVSRQHWDGTASYWEWSAPEGGFPAEGGGAVDPGYLGIRVKKPRKKAVKSTSQVPTTPDTQASGPPPL